MRIGIVGLPNVGKSSIFNLLTKAGAAVETYPFTTIDANRGMAVLADHTLDRLGQMLSPQKLTHAQIEVIDIAGLIKDAHKGEGLGNRFLGHIRDVDLLLHVIRGFADENIPHVFDTVDPCRDAEIVLSELALADLEIVERRLAKQRKKPQARDEVQLLERYHSLTSRGAFSLNDSYTEDETLCLRLWGLLIPRPRIDVLNLPDRCSSVELRGAYRLSVGLEKVLDGFDPGEREELRGEVGVDNRGVGGLVEEGRKVLGLIRFYTIKGSEVRAWLITEGSTAHEAAAKIHTDIADGFIKAEVVGAGDLIEAGSWQEASGSGKMKVEGKDYVVQDQDVLLVKFR
ncbi:redox-regulated ATPase YchF [candidate division TA06 bacterium B3_TA06]|uniref:Redox-regulated ATPase YchF n=1 Tax=candidate division TA06 bacterium B3_TA06 TaxID=2012487 RepID=A0A532V688_UNCT6|nr:MAG: redox-regulated ATPase YchF [candidate division TA06 bacterium B3_TA06]